MKNLLIPVFMLVISMSLLPLFPGQSVEGKSDELEKKLGATRGKEKIQYLDKLALEYRKRMPAKSMEYAKRALALAEKFDMPAQQAAALAHISRCFIPLGDNEKALEYGRRSLKMARQSMDNKMIGLSFNTLGIVYHSGKKYRQSLEYFQKSLKVREESGDKEDIAESLNNIGNMYLLISNYPRAREFHLKALEKRKELGNKKLIAKSFNNIGVIHEKLGDYEKSLEYHLQALSIRDEIGDPMDIAFSLNNIGAIYGRLNQRPKALEYFLRALKIKERIGNKREIAITLANIGMVQRNLGQYQKALESHQRSLKIQREMGNKRGIGNDLNAVGSVYFMMGKYPEALERFRVSLDLFRQTGNKLREAIALYNIGNTYLEMKDLDRALEFIQRAAVIVEKTKSKEILKDCYEAFAVLYEKKGDFKQALGYFKRFVSVKDTIFNEKSSRQVTEMQTRYDTLKKEKEIESLTNNKQIQELRFTKERMVRNTFILGFILVFIIAGLLFRKYLYLIAFWKKQKYIGQFRLMEEIGSGGMGTVYLAHSIRDKTDTAAIKVLRKELFKDESSRKRFKQEAVIIDKLDHPNIIRIIQRGEYKDKLFIAMEFLQGKTLAVKIAEKERMDLNECVHIMIQVSDALAMIHGKNIVHRDLKPANIMLIEREGDPNFVKLLDFGLAMMKFQTRITRTGILVGTVNYMSPEQLTGAEYSRAGDVYSLGVTFYQMVTGRLTFPGDTVNTIMKQILDQSPIEPGRLRPDLPVELNRLILDMLTKDSDSRPLIRDILVHLRQIRTGLGKREEVK
ncbi:MAG: tetratricopeptide repeat protein [bacterium]|nr:tetratricopeptide repeat protein [bacterium]